MTDGLSFEQALSLQPVWVQYWVLWLTIVSLGGGVLLLIWRSTRMAGLLTLAATVCAGFMLQWLYSLEGFTKLLGLSHVVFWTPLVVFLGLRLRRDTYRPIPRSVLIVLVVSLVASLAFDYIDVVRYMLRA